MLYADCSLRAPSDLLSGNRLGPPVLWSCGISGDLPIVLVRIDDESGLGLVEQLLRAHEYWRCKRLAVDLVILNDRPPPNAAQLQQALEAAIRCAQARRLDADSPGRASPALGQVFALRSDALPKSSSELLQTAARAIFTASLGSLSSQLERLREPQPAPRPRAANSRAKGGRDGPERGAAERGAAARSVAPLEFFNGLGGFASAGREYVTILDAGQWTPAPWTNVIANAQFGFLVSADGAGSTWSLNAQQNQLTTWSNDPVANSPAEVIYIRDQHSGDLWSATPLPIREPGPVHLVRHGIGYSRFEQTSHGISLELLQFVPLEHPLKISRLKLCNRGGEERRLSVTHYVDWVLGNLRSRGAPYIVTEIEPQTSALLARNPWSTGFETRVAFMDMRGRQQACTGDRTEFIGRHGSLAEPAALLVPPACPIGSAAAWTRAAQCSVRSAWRPASRPSSCSSSDRKHPPPMRRPCSCAIAVSISMRC